MSATPFKASGALTDEHAAIYIERRGDRASLTHLWAMDYLLVIEPRQQGKTSLINHLMCHPALGDMTFAYVDVSTPDRATEATWYQTLCPRILSQLRGFIPRKQWPAIPQTGSGWREFLCDIAMFATDAHRHVIIALDEIGAVTFPGATAFFSVLRDIYNSRQAESELKQLTFLLSGAFHPRDLIQDAKISPFNIAQRVRLSDFTLSQVRGLAGEGNWSDEQAATLAERIHYWTDGLPYLTQLLCSYLGPDATPADVDTGVERLRREDENHLPPMLERLNGEEKLRKYVNRVLDGERIKFYPRENRRQAQLELLGVIKADTEGFCTIRNRVYLQALSRLDTPLPQVPEILLDFTSTQSLIEQEWQSYGSQAETVQLTLEYDDSLRKLVLVKKGHGFDAAARYKHPNHPPLGWKCQYYELLVRMSPESVVCVNVLDKTGQNRTLLYSLEILPGLNQWSEFQIPLDRGISDGDWHSLLINPPKHVEQAQWTGFELVNWISLRGELSLAGIRGCDDQVSLLKSAEPPPYIVRFTADTDMPEPVPAPKLMSFPELGDSLTRRTLALFIGADLSHEVTGLPSRTDLARELARRKSLDEALSLAEVAQRVSQAGNRWKFTAFIRDQLDTTGKSPQLFHQRIVALVKDHQLETIITTAYDNLLELGFQEAGVGINRVVRGSDVSFVNPDHPTLIKLYGDAQQPDSLVVTDRDHSDLLRDRDKEALVDEVRRAFRRNTMLFLGYDLSDPDFRFLFDQIAGSRFARIAYAVWPGLPEADVRMWRDRGIVILDIDPFGILGEAAIEAVSQTQTDTVIPVPIPTFTGGVDMNYEHGLQLLEPYIKPEDEDAWRDFTLYKGQLQENLGDERRYGTTETLRNARYRIVDKLNPLALRLTGLSFTDLCLGKQPTAQTRPTSNVQELIERLQRIEDKLDRGRAEDRQAAAQILEAIAHNQVEQAEATETVAELRSWAQTVQQAGLPLNPELRTVLEALSEHTGSAYQYLQLALPIIPGILSYNVELGSQHQVDLKVIWERIRARLGKKEKPVVVKGDAAAPVSTKPVLNTGKAWAVLVGINEYDDPHIADLKVCVEDVAAVHGALDEDYEVAKLLTDATPDHLPTRANILGELSAITQATEEGDLLLFYFSGHGVAEGGESYLLPRDTRLSAIKHTAVSMRDVHELMEQSPARAKVIVLDACHSGASIGKAEPTMTPEFIKRVFEEAEGMAVLASCKQGQQSWEWREQKRSVFTYYLLEALAGQADLDEKGFVTVSDASRYVTDGVKSWAAQTGVPQTPTLQYTVAGDIILVRYQSGGKLE